MKGTPKCGKCGLLKTEENRQYFYKSHRTSTGMSVWCKECHCAVSNKSKAKARLTAKKNKKVSEEVFIWDESWLYM